MTIYDFAMNTKSLKYCYILKHGNPLFFLSKQDTFDTVTAQKMNFSIKDYFSKCDQIRK